MSKINSGYIIDGFEIWYEFDEEAKSYAIYRGETAEIPWIRQDNGIFPYPGDTVEECCLAAIIELDKNFNTEVESTLDEIRVSELEIQVSDLENQVKSCNQMITMLTELLEMIGISEE